MMSCVGLLLAVVLYIVKGSYNGTIAPPSTAVLKDEMMVEDLVLLSVEAVAFSPALMS